MKASKLDPRVGLGRPLPTHVRLGFALGDHTVNVSLAAVSIYYLFFLTEVAGLRPALASLVVLAGRAVDAITDPLMGRISDTTRSRCGRRRPYFLIGAIPFGLSYVFLWQEVETRSQLVLFTTYAGAYILHTLSSTVIAVPYMALLPELARTYMERTAMNVFRSGGAVLGVLLAASAIRPLSEAFGGGSQGFAQAGVLLGAWLTLPWLVVYAVTWERPGFARPTQMSFVEGIRRVARHGTYRRLVALFLSARIGLDLVGAMFLFYFHYWLGRPDDFPLTMALLLACVVVSLPLWLRLSALVDKKTIFVWAALWWVLAQIVLLFLYPSTSRWVVFAVACAAGIGYGLVDLMPWSMLGDVIDEDDLVTGERREGVYAGFFTFSRKLGGASGVAVAGIVLEVVGFVRGAEQTEVVLWTIRVLTAIVPALFLLLAAWLALSYPLGRERHAEILEKLEARRLET